MLYLANPCTPAAVSAMAAGLLGMIDTPYQNKVTRVREAHAAGATWCADNGAFSDRWDPDTWWTWLNAPMQTEHRATCLFATAPDVVGDAAATEARARPWLRRIRLEGYPVAYVAQDGMDGTTWDLWDEIDALFIGGTTEWKLGPQAAGLAQFAGSLGKWVHMGRVNSERRWLYAQAIGCQSVDGTYLAWGPDVNLPDVLAWGRNADQHALF